MNSHGRPSASIVPPRGAGDPTDRVQRRHDSRSCWAESISSERQRTCFARIRGACVTPRTERRRRPRVWRRAGSPRRTALGVTRNVRERSRTTAGSASQSGALRSSASSPALSDLAALPNVLAVFGALASVPVGRRCLTSGTLGACFQIRLGWPEKERVLAVGGAGPTAVDELDRMERPGSPGAR
jgi:hypothetical protein